MGSRTRQGIRLFLAVTGGAFAHVLVHYPLGTSLSSPLLAGVVIGLVAAFAAPVNLAVLGAMLGVVIGEVADVALGLESVWHAEHVLLAAAGAGGTAWGVVRALSSGRTRVRGWLTGIGLALILLGMIGSTVNNVKNPIWMDQSLYQMLQREPQPFQYGADESIYMRTYSLMHDHGMGYYEAAKKARYESKHAIGGVEGVAGGAISYRLPTGYVLWSMFPGPSGVTVLPLVMLIGAFAVLAGFVIAQRLVGNAAGLVAAAGVALFYAEIASSQAVLHVEPWAASMALGSICTMVIWRTTEPRDPRWLYASAALAFVAASIRELDAILIVAGLASCLLVERGARTRAAVPWVAAGGGFLVLYAAHWAFVGEGFLTNRGTGYWLQANVGRSIPVLSHGLSTIAGAPVLPVLIALVALVAIFGQKDSVLRTMLLVGVALPTVVFMLFGPAGTATVVAPDAVVTTEADLPGYWGGLTAPLVVVLSTLAAPVLLGLAGFGRSKTRSVPVTSDLETEPAGTL